MQKNEKVSLQLKPKSLFVKLFEQNNLLLCYMHMMYMAKTKNILHTYDADGKKPTAHGIRTQHPQESSDMSYYLNYLFILCLSVCT